MNDIIAFDFDGVLANTNVLKRKWLYDNIHKLFLNVDKTNIYDILSKTYSLDEINNIYYQMSQDIFTKKQLLKTEMMDQNLQYYLDILSQKYDFIIITNRPEYMIEWVNEWLSNKQIDKYFKKIISSSNNSKSNLALLNNASILIDDDIRHLNNSNVPYNILFNSKFIDNWEELLDYILNIKKIVK